MTLQITFLTPDNSSRSNNTYVLDLPGYGLADADASVVEAFTVAGAKSRMRDVNGWDRAATNVLNRAIGDVPKSLRPLVWRIVAADVTADWRRGGIDDARRYSRLP